jgi:hypothetical protein
MSRFAQDDKFENGSADSAEALRHPEHGVLN